MALPIGEALRLREQQRRARPNLAERIGQGVSLAIQTGIEQKEALKIAKEESVKEQRRFIRDLIKPAAQDVFAGKATATRQLPDIQPPITGRQFQPGVEDELGPVPIPGQPTQATFGPNVDATQEFLQAIVAGELPSGDIRITPTEAASLGKNMKFTPRDEAEAKFFTDFLPGQETFEAGKTYTVKPEHFTQLLMANRVLRTRKERDKVAKAKFIFAKSKTERSFNERVYARTVKELFGTDLGIAQIIEEDPVQEKRIRDRMKELKKIMKPEGSKKDLTGSLGVKQDTRTVITKEERAALLRKGRKPKEINAKYRVE